MTLSPTRGLYIERGVTEVTESGTGSGLTPFGGLSKKEEADEDVLSMVLDVDATQAACYPGSGVVLTNLVAAPADGSASSAYNFNLGDGVTATTFPTFTGSAGSASAYFAMDGGDWFQTVNDFTQFIKDLQKNSDGDSWWAASAFRTPASFTLNSHSGIFGGIGNSTFPGLRFSIIENVNAIRFNRQEGVGDLQSVDVSTLPAVATDTLIILSYQKGTRDVSCRINSVTPTFTGTSGALVGNSDATSSTNKFNTGGGGNGNANRMISGFRWYAFSMGNIFLDDTGAEALVDLYEGRHGRNYA